ncbi:MAG TPA: endonuclease/exonuclease/phosphatase family protein [Thermoanaerobaculia bacterium]|nr:endonuclease/exonuclease/phosphatase family protein [Thermoanaerobaculia bacterium]
MRFAAFVRLLILFAAGLAPFAYAQDLTVASFNVESGGADPATLGQDLRRIPITDVWGFSEVRNASWAQSFDTSLTSAGNDYETILGTTGGEDRLLIVFNSTRLERVSNEELSTINIGGNGRAPLVARFRRRNGGEEFLFVVNHLFRGNAAGRRQQATALNAWAATQTLPVIAVGDYNFDWNLPNGETSHDPGFDNMVANGVFRWVRPATLIKTQCDPNFNSVLDFVFVAGPAQNWQGTSEILFQEPSYCPDDNRHSDHRPIRAAFTFSNVPQPEEESDFDALLLQRIEAIERQLEELKQMIRDRPPQ